MHLALSLTFGSATFMPLGGSLEFVPSHSKLKQKTEIQLSCRVT